MPESAPDLSLVDMGYIESGHGAKGRRIWLCDDGDIEKMYSEHNKKKITLWCYTGPSSKKREKQCLQKVEKWKMLPCESQIMTLNLR